MSAPRWRFVGARTIAVGLALAVLVSSEVSVLPTHANGKGRDLSGPISAVRGAQIAAESSMRAADKRILSLKRATKGAQRRLRKSRRRHDRFIERRVAANADARAAAAELASARADLARREEELAAIHLERNVLGAAVAAGNAASAALAMGPEPADTHSSAGTSARTTGGPAAHDVPASAADLEHLERAIAMLDAGVDRLHAQSRRAERTTRRIERGTRRAGRKEAAAKRRMRNIRVGIRTATGQQRGSEASLAAYIQSMTRLAHLRAAKKTKGRGSPAFIMPVHGRLSQGYHGGHDGLDLVAGRGTPIRAMAPGVVAYVGWNPWDSRPRAFIVVIAHQGGYETKYGHLLPRRGVVHGELVRRGEVIGYMGNTGHSTGVHLHLEVSRGFQTINPYSVL